MPRSDHGPRGGGGRGRATPSRLPLARVRGAARLAVEATTGVTDVVEAMHRAIGSGPAVLGRPLALPLRLFASPVFQAIRGVTSVVGASVDVGLAAAGVALAPLLADGRALPEPELLVAILNGVLGDHLAETGNPLAQELCLVHDGRVLDPRTGRVPAPTRRLLVLVHGSCMTDRRWLRRGHDHGAALARDLGFTHVYVRYNTGLHISVNGRALADQLERLVGAHPSAFDELVLLGHSMGGLVSRSACHFGEARGHAWRRKLRKLVCVGSPHHGAPLERGGHWIDALLGVTPYTVPLVSLGRIRSAGVTDLRFGSVLDEDWAGRDRFGHTRHVPAPLPLPAGVACYALAGSTSPETTARPRGDGLVPVESALGRHRDPARALGFPPAHQWVAHATGHVELLGSAAVYGRLRDWLAQEG